MKTHINALAARISFVLAAVGTLLFGGVLLAGGANAATVPGTDTIVTSIGDAKDTGVALAAAVALAMVAIAVAGLAARIVPRLITKMASRGARA